LARQIDGGQWTSGAVSTELPYVIYDLQQSHNLDKMLVWNRNTPTLNANGVQHVTISTSDDGADYTDLPDYNGDLEDGNYTVDMSPGGDAAYQLDVDLTGVTARYVKLLALDNWGGTEEDFGISEVRFYSDEASVPIPGDANNSGTVDEDDAKILANHWGASGTEVGWSDGDFDGDHVVGPKDASILAANWSDSGGGGSASTIPEPSTLVLLASMLFFASWRRRTM
jgi:hypothetical protein